MRIDIETAAHLDEALDALSRARGALRPVAGGTDLLLRLRTGKWKATRLLGIEDVKELAGVQRVDGHLEIGATTRIADLLAYPELCRELPALHRAASQMGSPQIRNRATVGGNLGNASPAGDLAPALIALGATVTLRSLAGARTLPVEDLFIGPGKTRLAPEELIATVCVPCGRPRFQAFAKFGNRSANVIAAVNMALCLRVEGGCVEEARIAFGCCGPTPRRALGLERHLVGKALDETLIGTVAAVLQGELEPIDDVRGSRRYKELLAIHATEDALAECLEAARHAA